LSIWSGSLDVFVGLARWLLDGSGSWWMGSELLEIAIEACSNEIEENTMKYN